MKTLNAFAFSILALLALGAGPAFQANADETMSLKKVKELFDLYESGVIGSPFTSLRCVSPGFHCSNSNDCCGASMCQNGACGSNGVGCRGNGARCSSSNDCCGSSMCHNGTCDGGGTGCRDSGAACNSSNDCCGSSMCHDGFCS
jgi:hypothetical protein